MFDLINDEEGEICSLQGRPMVVIGVHRTRPGDAR